MISIMAFDRKWVSESNLDKLLNDTIEKKEANKQRRSPDFCKEAVLSATLKRISSEMLMQRISSPMLDIDISSDDSDDEDDGITVLTNVPMKTNSDTQDTHVSSVTVDANTNEKTYVNLTPIKISDSHSYSELNVLSKHHNMETSDSSTSPEYPSPKRKWNEDEDDQCLKVPHVSRNTCSPAKRLKNGICTRTESKSMSPKRNRKYLQSPTSKSFNTHKIKESTSLTTLPQLNAVPSEDNSSVTPKPCINNALLSPVKSMVHSISELTLGVQEQWKSNETELWCLPLEESSHSDPLELDSFFNNLKKVTS